MALTTTPAVERGTPCPDFRLPATSGQTLSRDQVRGTNGLLVMFICNHCPYVKAIEDRLVTLAVELKEIGIGVVGISANDANDYPEDSFEEMTRRAQDKSYPFPYLYDESQEVAKSFGAVCTPDFFMYDKDLRLAYRGRLDDSWKDASAVKNRELLEAGKLLAQGRPLSGEQVPSMGCSIKWKGARK